MHAICALNISRPARFVSTRFQRTPIKGGSSFFFFSYPPSVGQIATGRSFRVWHVPNRRSGDGKKSPGTIPLGLGISFFRHGRRATRGPGMGCARTHPARADAQRRPRAPYLENEWTSMPCVCVCARDSGPLDRWETTRQNGRSPNVNDFADFSQRQ